MQLSWNRLFLVAAVLMLFLATLAAGGVITGDLPWALPGGLTALALAMLIP